VASSVCAAVVAVVEEEAFAAVVLGEEEVAADILAEELVAPVAEAAHHLLAAEGPLRTVGSW